MDRDPEADRAQVDRCARLVEAVGRLQMRNGSRDGLRPAQWQALRFDRDRPGAPLRDLASDRHSTVSAASVVVSKLGARGLLTRTQGRGTRNLGLQVSERGRACLATDPLEDVKRALGHLQPHELAHLLDGLTTVHDTLRQIPGRSDDDTADDRD